MESSPKSIGFTFASFQSLGLRFGVDIARRAEVAGLDSFWTAETVGHEAFATLAAVGASTDSIALGTGVLALQLRTPMLAAMGAATLQELRPHGEILLGVGISSPVVVGRWHGSEYRSTPIAQTREYLQMLRAALSGETVNEEGDHYRSRGFRLGVRLSEQRPRIVLGALNARMLRLAGELADGVLLNYLPATAVQWCVEQVREGEKLARRPDGACRIYAYVHVGVCEREQARAAARKDLFSYAVVPAYGRAFSRAGFGEEVEAINAAHAARNREGALAAVSDAMIDAIDICGSDSEVQRAIEEYLAAGVDHAVVMPLPWGEDRRSTIDATLDATIGVAKRPAANGNGDQK